MDSKDKLILEMLKNGKSYTDIQSEINVSPSRIAKTKKQYLNTSSSNNEELLPINITTINPSDSLKKLESEEKNKVVVIKQQETEKKESFAEILKKHKEELKSFVKEIITTSLDNPTTRTTTTSSSNSENSEKEHIKVEKKTEISPSNKIPIETTTQNSSATTDINQISDNTKEISSEVLKLIGEKCQQCDKTFILGMTIVTLEENNKMFYFCCKSCYRKYNKEKIEKEELEYKRRMRMRRMRKSQNNIL